MKKKLLAMMCMFGVAGMLFTGCGQSASSSDSSSQDAEEATNTEETGDDTQASTGNEIEGSYTYEDENGVVWDLEITETHYDIYGTKVNDNDETIEVSYSGPCVMNTEGTDHSGKLADPLYLRYGGAFDVKVDGTVQAAGDTLYDEIASIIQDENYVVQYIQINLDTENGTLSLVNSDQNLHVGEYWE